MINYDSHFQWVATMFNTIPKWGLGSGAKVKDFDPQGGKQLFLKVLLGIKTLREVIFNNFDGVGSILKVQTAHTPEPCEVIQEAACKKFHEFQERKLSRNMGKSAYNNGNTS